MEENKRAFASKGPRFWPPDTLSDLQKDVLAETIFNSNADDERYLRVHPEIEHIIASVVMAAHENPPSDPLRFAVDYLSGENLKERVESQVRKYRIDDMACRRLHELEYGGTVSNDTEAALMKGKTIAQQQKEDEDQDKPDSTSDARTSMPPNSRAKRSSTRNQEMNRPSLP